MVNLTENFACNVFSDKAMKAKLPPEVYDKVREAISEGHRLDLETADVMAEAMKDWAIEKGATHYTHWFQPMTGVTAEKHDSFISLKDGDRVIMNFSGKELFKGEPDASSFPSGGLRATFEARGYTAWDPTSPAFIKEGVLCIPTAFMSYSGEALDQKTPLLRSMQAINRQAKRIMKLFGNETKGVKTTVGAEQEYFLIDKKMYDKRKDLIFTNRTLFGCKPPKGQEMDDHYFGSIWPRVLKFMSDLDEELWKLGVPAKTEHNEVAPSQHELAPIFTTTNIASDQNQLTMEIMQKIAEKHGFVCLLHEKPFDGVNGSGKHNNWSICTQEGVNLLEPGDTPYDNAQFLLFLCAVIKAVDDYQDLLRISVATAGNDHRLGANEAPPAVLSMFLGEELGEILEAIETGTAYDQKEKSLMKVGVHVLPKFPKDSTDRNRTSPFAFTGNKFEFRMLGSASTISSANIVLNTIVAESLKSYADRLEDAPEFEDTLHKLIRKTIKDHKRIVFNGNGYDDEWIKEAEKRGLLNLPTTPDALEYLLSEKNVTLFETHKVFTRAELEARYEIYMENYCKTINIEGLTASDMVKRDILPAITGYIKALSETVIARKKATFSEDKCYEESLIKRLTSLSYNIYELVEKLDAVLAEAKNEKDIVKQAEIYKTDVLGLMEKIREAADSAESVTDSRFWPYPSYGDMLFSI
ncbi:MAG: glutamine synthetase III [Clostridia bacterium]|nr:glutamine synthetase III [Clostridia bacterium]